MKLFKVRVFRGDRLYVGWMYARTQREANAKGKLRL